MLRDLLVVGEIDQHKLAAKIWYDRSRLSKLLRFLEYCSLVTRTRLKRNRYSYSIALTSLGRGYVQQLEVAASAASEDALRGYSPEKQLEFLSMLEQIIVNLNIPGDYY